MKTIDIEDIEDERIRAYRAVRDRDLARRAALFMAEGRVVLDALLTRGRFPLESVLVSDRKLRGHRPVLERIPSEVPIYVLPHGTMLELVGYPIHRGLIAAGQRREVPTAEQLLAECGDASPAEQIEHAATVMVLEAITNHDNMGACFRNAAALGADAILLEARCCDPLYRKAIRVSAGHALSVPYSGGDTTEQLLETLGEAGFVNVALCLGDSVPLRRSRPAERLAIWLGTEGPGLSPEAINGADMRVHIPMAVGVDSLNVATAGALALFAYGSS